MSPGEAVGASVENPRPLPRPLGDAVPRENLVFACAEVIDGAEASFAGDAALFAAMRGRISARTRAVAPVFPAFAYGRPAPRYLAGSEPAQVEAVRAYYGRIDEPSRTYPAAVLCESNEIRLNGDVLHYHEGGTLRILYETCRLSECHSIEADDLYATQAAERFDDGGVYLHLGSVGSHNYGHWLIDDVPRLEAFFTLRALHPGRTITIVMPGHNMTIDDVRLRTVRLYLGWDADWHVVFLKRDTVYAFERLYHVTPCSQQPVAKSPEAVATMRQRLLRNTRLARLRDAAQRAKAKPLKFLAGRGRRIFVDRRSFNGRALVNREEIVAVLKRRGFEVVYPELITQRDQIVRFARADFVVGIMGAAMANTVFCAPGTRVLHLAPDTGWADPFFWDLAAVCGHRYAAVYGRWAESDRPERLRDFALPVAELEAALRAV